MNVFKLWYRREWKETYAPFCLRRMEDSRSRLNLCTKGFNEELIEDAWSNDGVRSVLPLLFPIQNKIYKKQWQISNELLSTSNNSFYLILTLSLDLRGACGCCVLLELGGVVTIPGISGEVSRFGGIDSPLSGGDGRLGLSSMITPVSETVPSIGTPGTRTYGG